MALTAAEKQQRYRERHLGVHGTKERIQLFISVQAKAQLGRLARHLGYTVTKVIETLAVNAESAILDQLPARQHRAYLDGKIQRTADDAPAMPKRRESRKPRKGRPKSRRRVTA
jgi:hypothetical protein